MIIRINFKNYFMKRMFLLIFFVARCFTQTSAQQKLTPEKEVWSPEPVVITPGHTVGDVPSDAIILFDGKNTDEWVPVKDSTMQAKWPVANGMMTVDRNVGTIRSKRKFLDYQLHIEWRVPENVSGEGQARSNSGVILASTGERDNGYELQVLDSYHNKTYINGQAGAVYNQYAPLVNACKKLGEWQCYDIIWIAPRFNEDGTLKTAAYVTAFLNGILIQYNVPLRGPTSYYPNGPAYKKHGATSIKLQSHGDPGETVSYRNIWVRNLSIFEK